MVYFLSTWFLCDHAGRKNWEIVLLSIFRLVFLLLELFRHKHGNLRLINSAEGRVGRIFEIASFFQKRLVDNDLQVVVKLSHFRYLVRNQVPLLDTGRKWPTAFNWRAAPGLIWLLRPKFYFDSFLNNLFKQVVESWAVALVWLLLWRHHQELARLSLLHL